MPDPALSARGVVKSYDGKKAIDGVTFEASRGELLAVLGARGAGKTTLLSLLKGDLLPDSGRMTVGGLDPSDRGNSAELRRRVGWMGQSVCGFPRLTVQENISFFSEMAGYGPDSSLLEGAGLSSLAGSRYSRLTPAERKRVGLALAFSGSPETVLLDEPTAGLDAEARPGVWAAVKGLSRGKTTLVATSSCDEAVSLGARICVMVRGVIVAADTPANLVASFGKGKAVVFKDGGETAFGTLRRFFEGVAMDGRDVLLPFENIRDLEVALRELVGRGVQPDITMEVPSLKSVLMTLMGGSSEGSEA